MSEAHSRRAPVGVFGGTFNPVHYGHLRSALELLERLQLSELRLMPCAFPPHRDLPECSAQDRAAMVDLAITAEPRIVCDRRELQRRGKSYTIDSLTELRAELGSKQSICLMMGADAVAGVNSWHRWRELLDLAHVVVIARPGWQLPATGEVADWVARHRVDSAQRVHDSCAGLLLVEELRPLSISSTEIRSIVADGRSARYLLPESVLDYIHAHKLYV